MKTLRLLFVLALVIMVVSAGGMVYAAGGPGGGGGPHGGGGPGGGGGPHGGGGGHFWGGHGGPRFDFDVLVGGPFWGASWYYPYYYPRYYYPYYPYYDPYYESYAPAASVPSMPREYIERSYGEPSSTPSGVWYYCPKSKAYYPYVRRCPGGWQTVPAEPPSELER